MNDNKRDAERLELLEGLRADVLVFQPTIVRQISERGMQVETTSALQLDSLHDFRISLGEVSVVLKGRVVHCRISDVGHDLVTYAAGVEFVAPSAHAMEAIASFIAASRPR